MKLNYDRKSKDPTYFVQQGIRNGKKTTTRNVSRIGKHSELLAITEDPLSYAREKVRQYNEDFKEGRLASNIAFNIDFSQKVKATNDIASHSNQVNIGYFILQRIYSGLRLKDYFAEVTKDSKVTFDCNEINRFLIYARVLDPKSKRGTFDNLSAYYENPDFGYQHILRFMDVLESHYDSYIEHLFLSSSNIVPRNTGVCYYDCTNYYFEIETEDEDYIDPVTGEVLKGMRKYAISKDHRPNPVVQMGLFMDGSGIPISMCINPGSNNEQTSAVPLEEKILKMFKGKPFVYCADAGLGSLSIRNFNSMGGRAFIVTQSIKKMSDVLKNAVFNDYDYKRLSNDESVTIREMKSFDKSQESNLHLYNDHVYKIVDAPNVVELGLYEEKLLKNGKTQKVKTKACLKQKVIITFSRKVMEYQRAIRNRQIERANKLIKTDSVESVRKGSHDVTRFIKRTSKAKSGGGATYDIYELDLAIIEEEEKYDGYYAVATNLDDNAKDILAVNSNRYKIEDCFRVLKTNFEARPVFHRNNTRIIAHFMICYTALLIYRLIEKKLDDYGTHFTTAQLLSTLKNMNLANRNDLFYEALYNGSRVCTALNGVFGLDLDKQYYLPKELNKKIKEILK
ncbi:MAG: IS1634 family transposase [Clostridiales Family XIII bacterium]|jgi:transposase|nr:IS1634 family transposase [Clostridiales Family XIII bacterium]